MADKKRFDSRQDDFEDRMIKVNRVAKVLKGGKKFSFNAMVVVGDKSGRVGIGLGKANEVANAVNKAKEIAKKNLFKVPIIKDTIPHEVIGRFGASKILLKPAAFGTGVIAGGAARPVLELAGIKNILTKSLGSNNVHNLVKATVNGLQQLESALEVAERRGKTIRELFE